VCEELFDVVDEHDQVIEVRPRSEVHRLQLRHRATHIFLFRSDGRMLIHLRSASKEEFPSVWTSSASGHVSSGETYFNSATRELQEELGITAPLRFVTKVPACAQTSFEFTELYRADCDADVTIDPEEIQEVQWQTIDEIKDQLAATAEQFSPAFQLLFEEFLKRQAVACRKQPSQKRNQ
jgi:isopentenyl-diphosphate Delta-isomerase